MNILEKIRSLLRERKKRKIREAIKATVKNINAVEQITIVNTHRDKYINRTKIKLFELIESNLSEERIVDYKTKEYLFDFKKLEWYHTSDEELIELMNKYNIHFAWGDFRWEAYKTVRPLDVCR